LDRTSHSSGLGTSAQSAIGNQGREVEQYLTACLLADNQAEVELSQFAQQHAKSSEVKEFAQMMVQDHQKMIQQLQQLSGATGSAGRNGALSATESGRNSTTSSSSARQSSRTSNIATNGASANESAIGASGSTDSIGTGTSTAATGRNTASSDLPGRGSALNSLGPGGAVAAQTAAGGGAVHQLMQIDRQIVERKSQSTREELQQKSGAEFDKGFVGTAINAHIHALAALEVIGQQSQGQLAQVAQQARPTVQQHLEHAKQLMKKLEGEAGNSTTASRPTDSRSER